MENSNKEKTVDSEMNFSPTRIYQYEESKTEEPCLSTNIQEFNSDNPPLIVDETNYIQSSEINSFEQTHIHESVSLNQDNTRESQQEMNPQTNNEGDRNLDNEFYQHSLQYLVQNLNNLRDTLQTILTNNDLVQELGVNNQQRRQVNISTDNLNNEDHLHDQLLDFRRILSNNANENNIQNHLEGQNFLNIPRNNLNNTRNNLSAWINTFEISLRQVFASIPKSFNLIFWILFLISIIFIIFGISNTPPNFRYQNPDYFVQWLAFHKNSRLFLLGSILLFICLAYKFNQIVYVNFTADPEENFHKTMLTAFLKYSRFYDISLFVVIDTSIVTNKLDMFFISLILIWYTASNKVINLLHQKLNQSAASIHQQTDNSFMKMKHAQFVAAIYLIINLHIGYISLWMAWHSSYSILFVLLSLALLANLEPLKVFLSGSILIKNYSLVSNNNTKELSDPKFKVELLIDLIYHFVVLILIAELGLASARYFTGFVGLYWLSLNNSIDKLKSCYYKYLNWIKLQKKIDELFPIIERSIDEPEEVCSICHENLLVARKLQCGHIFHIKCLIYWLENQKTCPNCRANVTNLNEIMGNNRTESTLGRIFSQIIRPLRNLFRV